MAFHTFALTASLAISAIDSDLLGVTDNFLTLNAATKYIFPKPAKLMAAWYGGASALRAKLNSASLRNISLPYLVPFDTSLTPPDLPAIVLYDDNPINIPATEEIDVLGSNSNGAAVDRQYAILWAEFNRVAAPLGDTRTVRATAAIAAVTNAWVSGTFTLDSTLTPGTYSVIGMRVVGANLVAARLIPTEGGPRPGCLAATAVGNDDRSYFRMGRVGEFLRFPHTAIPNIEIFSAGANTAQEIFLDVVRVSGPAAV